MTKINTEIRNDLGRGYLIHQDFIRRINLKKEILPSDSYDLLIDGCIDVYNLYSKKSNKTLRVNSANNIKDKWHLGTNENRKKAYVRTIPGMFRKILCGESGTVKSIEFISDIGDMIGLQIINDRKIKQKFFAASKKWHGTKIYASEDEFVREIFSHDILSRVNDAYKQVYILYDGEKQLVPSSDYSREYLEHSINNDSLKSVIEVANTFIKSDDINAEILTALLIHQSNLQRILDTCEIPSEDAKNQIGESYDILMSSLYKIDDQIASAIMKQFAEYRMYEQSIAEGVETYLPSHTSFPTGDIIIMNSTHPMGSCKYGRSGRLFGCPANAKSITQLHPNESKRFNQGTFIGEDGFDLVINNKLTKGNTTQETIYKITDFIPNMLNEIGLGNLFSKKDINNIAVLCAEYYDYIDKCKSEFEGTKPRSLYWQKFILSVPLRYHEFNQRMAEIVTFKQIEQLVGGNNAKYHYTKLGTEINPSNVLCLIEIANNIRTSNGYGILHNKQYVDKDFVSHCETLEGISNPDDYAITSRMNKTSGRAGGGIQISYVGDGDVKYLSKM